ncbi:uncharacterized protein SOCE26_056370 [Sorangium cellulosum]|uniref:DUF6968 domain-containing protein n=2 Tax=Sorangium cellulosum TaxID=56 RepID=A0A2L0EXY7_SORCE|nr:hypothetical protein [Sorangium cellulosum]AUX44174.1 uncharacterized protein SOCE26_056370 [Sorangium cellulosum]
MGSWKCDVEIQEGSESHTTHACGEDSMQALQLALRSIETSLKPYEDEGTLTWLGASKTGFPASNV